MVKGVRTSDVKFINLDNFLNYITVQSLAWDV